MRLTLTHQTSQTSSRRAGTHITPIIFGSSDANFSRSEPHLPGINRDALDNFSRPSGTYYTGHRLHKAIVPVAMHRAHALLGLLAFGSVSIIGSAELTGFPDQARSIAPAIHLSENVGCTPDRALRRRRHERQPSKNFPKSLMKLV